MISLDPKTTISLKVGVVLIPVFNILEKYIFKDWEFLAFLIVLIMVDTALGIYKHWKMKTVSSKGFSQLFEKILIYTAALVVTHVMTNFMVSGEPNALFGWVDRLIYGAIMVREAISIFENIGAINSRLLPIWILKRLKQFDETGDPNAMLKK